MIDVNDIREQFPEPKGYDPGGESDEDPACYCVGGAFLRYLFYSGYDIECAPNFPMNTQVSYGLGLVNPKFSDVSECMRAARNITDLNDQEKFEQAWRLLDYYANKWEDVNDDA